MKLKPIVAIDRNAALNTLRNEQRRYQGDHHHDVLYRYEFAILTVESSPTFQAVPLEDYLALEEKYKKLRLEMECCTHDQQARRSEE